MLLQGPGLRDLFAPALKVAGESILSRLPFFAIILMALCAYPHSITAGTAQDTTAPTVSMTAPAAGATVNKPDIFISASASDNTGVVGVQFQVDGVNLGAEDTTAPYAMGWYIVGLPDGPHTLTAVARDAAGNQTTSAPIAVTKDTTPPVVSMTVPAAGATVSRPDILISASASDNTGVVGVQFRVDGVDLGAEDTTAPYASGWYIVGLPDGPHTLTAVARDAAGNQTTSAPITVTKDTTPPVVSMTVPAAGATVSRPDILISASASDNTGVVGVQFQVDGVDLGAEDTTAPYAMGWYIVGLPDGPHTLTAVARDAGGNQTTSVPILVTKDTTPPVVSLAAPATSATVSGSAVMVSAAASDNIGVVGVQFLVDGVNLGAEDTTVPYAIAWFMAGVPDGPHVLTAVARDAAGNQTTSAPIAVTKDTTAPAVSLTAPATSATVSGSAVMVSATASDNIGVVGVQFLLDGVNLGAEDTTTPYAIIWDATVEPDGPHVLTVVARDAGGNQTTSAPIAVTKITPDTRAPAVSMTAPSAGGTVSGSAVMVSATASDNIGVVGVQFRLDGVNLGAENMAAPYSIIWDTTAAANGVHTLTAMARDAAGNQTISAPIAVTKITPVPSMTAPSSGAMGSAKVQYVRVKPDAAVAPPVGVVTLTYRNASTLVSETTLTSSVPVQSGRIYADLASSIKTGIALANPNDRDATVAFYFANAGGTPTRSGVYTLLANRQIAAFLDAAPFSGPTPMQGTFTFTSSVAISAVAVRGLINERGDFLMAQVPVSSLGQEGERVLMFPGFEDRGNGQDSVILLNPTSHALSGSLQFFGQPGATGSTFPVSVGGGPNSTIPYVLPPQGEVTIRLQGAADAKNVGSARIIPSSGTVPLGLSLFSYKSNLGVTVSDTILPSVTPGQAFRMSVVSSNALNQVESVRMALALFNPSTSAVTALLELHDLHGALVGPVESINLPAGGQLSRPINELLTQMPAEFRGVLRVTASSPLVVAGLQSIRNGRDEVLVTAVPAWNESMVPSGSESNFAYVLNGGGYTPTFVVLSPAPASGDAGKVWLVNQDGSTTDTIEIN